MLTTDGIALRAAPLNDVSVDWLAVSGGGGSLMVTTSLCSCHENRSGRSVDTTNSTARQTVAVWQKVSHSLRMRRQSRLFRLGLECGRGRCPSVLKQRRPRKNSRQLNKLGCSKRRAFLIRRATGRDEQSVRRFY